MKWNDFNQNWEFQHGEPSSIPMMPQKKETVSLPHDFMIAGDVSPKAPGGAETGFYTGVVGSYTKYLELTGDVLLEANRSIAKALKEAGAEVSYEEGEGAHDWDFWDAYIQHVIKWLDISPKRKT